MREARNNFFMKLLLHRVRHTGPSWPGHRWLKGVFATAEYVLGVAEVRGYSDYKQR
jgi:hypothetical protein